MEARTIEAREELGETAVATATAATLVALAAATLVAVPLLRLGAADGFVASDAWAGAAAELATVREERGALAANRVLERRIDAFESRLEGTSPWLAVAQPWVQWALVVAGGVGNEEVVLGRDGWLHYRPGLDLVTGPPFLAADALDRRRAGAPAWEEPPHPDPRPAILDLARRLGERDVALAFLPVPPKVAVQPGTLAAGDATSRPRNASTEPLLRLLATAGVVTVDPTPALAALGDRGVDAYLRTDSHWSPAGVDAVAALVAEELARRGLVSPAASAARETTATVTGEGDLAALLRLPAGHSPFPPQTVEVRRATVAADAPAEVLLLGDSFTNVYARPDLGWGTGAGLAERLATRLGRPVDVVARNDGGATGTRRELARRLAAGDDLLAGKRVVVWQVAARELARGDWRVVPLPSSPATTPPPTTSTEAVTVTATVAAVAPTPAPAETPYRELLVAVHLVDVEGLDAGDVLVYAWGLRDARRAEGSRLAPGQRVAATLVPWATVAEDVESLERRELADDALLYLEPWLAEEIGDAGD